MKLFAVVVVVLVLALNLSKAVDVQKEIGEAQQACVKEVNLSPENLEKLEANDRSNADNQLQCFEKCVLEKLGLANAKGDLQEKKAIEFLSAIEDEAEVIAKFEICKKIHNTDPCAKVHEQYTCYLNTRTD